MLPPTAAAEGGIWALQWEPGHFKYNFDVRKGEIFTSWFKGATTNM